MTIPTGHKDRTDAVLENLKRREIVRVERTDRETLPQAYIDELDRIKLDLEKFKDSQQFVLPHAFKELIDRVANLETITAKLAQYAVTPQPVDITPDTVSDDLVEALRLMRMLMAEVDTNRRRSDAQFDLALNRCDDLAARVHAWTVGASK
jgi:hypothetical protein